MRKKLSLNKETILNLTNARSVVGGGTYLFMCEGSDASCESCAVSCLAGCSSPPHCNGTVKCVGTIQL